MTEKPTHLPLLPTTVVGSYAVAEWLERAKTDYLQRHLGRDQLEEIHNTVIKAAIKDQEVAGIDVISDGELRRDNEIDYFLMRMPGVDIDRKVKAYYYDFYESVVRHPIPMGRLGLVEDFLFLRHHTQQPIKFSLTGPFSLAKRIKNEAYPGTDGLARDLAAVLNAELKALVAAGAEFLQIDEPYLSGYPEEVDAAIRAINVMTEGVEAYVGLHVCYGNRYGKPSWEGHYDFLFPAVLDAHVSQLTLEFARRGYDDLRLFRDYRIPFDLGLGVIDVKDPAVESPDLVARRIRTALESVPVEKIYVNPDCGLRHLPTDVALAKLIAMAQGAAQVRREVG